MQNTWEEAEKVAGVERPRDEVKKVHIQTDFTKTESKTPEEWPPYEFEISEEITTADTASDPFILPPLMNENRHVLMDNDHVRFVKSSQRRRRIGLYFDFY